MGKTLDALLGRSFKPSKFKALVNLSISRLAILKNQKLTRCAISRSDVIQLLKIGEQERALIRVEQVVRERNMLDVYAMIEGYCILLSERVTVMEHDKVCPDELKEAISSMIFAASRCGEFPEIQEMRKVFKSRYGKEFARRATELRNNCGVNPKLIQKLSTRQPSLENRIMVLKEIADENGIELQIPSMAAEEKIDDRKEKQPEVVLKQSVSVDSANLREDFTKFTEVIDDVMDFGALVNKRMQSKHVADAAQEAFLSAAYAAAAARAAVELSRSIPRSPDNPSDLPDDRKQVLRSNNELRYRGDTDEGTSSGEIDDHVLGLVMAQPIDNYSLESEDDEETLESDGPRPTIVEQMDTKNHSSTTSGALKKDEQLEEVECDGSKTEALSVKFSTVSIKDQQEETGAGLPYYSPKPALSSIQGGLSTNYKVHSSAGSAVKRAHWMTTTKKNSMSVRTRK